MSLTVNPNRLKSLFSIDLRKAALPANFKMTPVAKWPVHFAFGLETLRTSQLVCGVCGSF